LETEHERITMKRVLISLFALVTLLSAEPIQYGAYYGDIKVSLKNYNSYVDNDASSAGTLYLYKKDMKVVDYIYKTKIEHIKTGLNSAKKLAEKNGNKYYAVDNITHQVIVTENSVIVLTNYNVLSFD